MMMPEGASFDELISRLRRGDNDAATEVVQRFAQRLIYRARFQLDQQLHSKVDPEDVIQSVFRSFFLRHADGQFELANERSLWALLVTLTLRKCGRWNERFRSAKRNTKRERPMDNRSPDDSSAVVWQPASEEPTAEEVATLTETLEQIMTNLDTRQQQVLVMRLQGYTVREISVEVGIAERTINRWLQTVRRTLTRMQDADL